MSVAPEIMPPGTRVRGPTALGNDTRRLLRLTWTLAATDFKLRFFGSALGYLWQLMRPLMLFGILFVVFTQILDVTGPERYFGVSLLLGIVLYNFFGEATGGAVKSILYREQLVRKIDFPRLAVPLSTVLQALFNLGLNLAPVIVFLLVQGGRPRLSWLLMPLLIVLLATLGLALAMLLSSLYVRYRDIEPIWDVVLQGLFYATPILYTVSLVKAKAGAGAVQLLLVLNPFAAILQESKHVLIDPSRSPRQRRDRRRDRRIARAPRPERHGHLERKPQHPAAVGRHRPAVARSPGAAAMRAVRRRSRWSWPPTSARRRRRHARRGRRADRGARAAGPRARATPARRPAGRRDGVQRRALASGSCGSPTFTSCARTTTCAARSRARSCRRARGTTATRTSTRGPRSCRSRAAASCGSIRPPCTATSRGSR